MKTNKQRLATWLMRIGMVMVVLGVVFIAPTAWDVLAACCANDPEFTATPTATVQAEVTAESSIIVYANTTPPPAMTTASPTPEPTATPVPALTSEPVFTEAATSTASPADTLNEAWRLIIPSIDLNTIIVGVGIELQSTTSGTATTWDVPDMFAAGWHIDSAAPGDVGNTVLNGHNNVYGEVFRYLDEVEAGDLITIQADGETYTYTVTELHLLRDKYVSLEQQTENAQWVLPTDDNRLTLVTCWPYTGNSHRLIIIAVPAEEDVGYAME